LFGNQLSHLRNRLKCRLRNTLLLSLLVAFTNVPVFAVDTNDATVTLSVHTEYPDELSWTSAQEFTSHLSAQNISVTPSQQESSKTADLKLIPLHELADEVPALQVLTLPFYYPDLPSIHQSLDTGLFDLLKDKSRHAGWELLAVWDEGLRHFSGNRRFDRRINLTGMEFILLNQDPIAEKQFRAFDAWTRVIKPQSQQELLKHCLVGSRADSLQRIWHDRLDRVHLDVTLSGHRYKGWVMVAPVSRWQQFTQQHRNAIHTTLAKMQTWQREQALQRERDALDKLTENKMTIHTLSDARRKEFIAHLPEDTAALLPDTLSAEEKQQLLSATATVARSALR
jgi:TRAP-type C4-dicarboxylate transport system substrate-binding protein